MKSTVELAPGLTISPIITGLWQIADMERKEGALDPKATAQFMAPYIEAGLTTFDMADHYGSSEIIAGNLYSDHPSGTQGQYFTKWVPSPGKINRTDTRLAVETALKRMQRDSLDLMQFHAWKYSDPNWLDGLFYLDELRQEGLIKHIGVTNFDAIHLKMALDTGIPLVSNQVCHSLLDQRAAGQLGKVCEDYDVKLLAFGTLAGGFLTDKWLNQAEPSSDQLSTWSEMKYKRFIDVAGGWSRFQALLSCTKEISEKHQVSIANIASRYILDNPHVAAIVVGARLGRSEHISDTIRILQLQLDQEDHDKIFETMQLLQPITGDCGDEYRRPPYLTASGDLSHHLDVMPDSFDPVQNGARSQVFSGTPWEGLAGYCRAIRDGNRILVSGTTATHGDRLIGGDDPSSQTHFILDKIEGAIESLGGKMQDVVRTRIFINEVRDWEPVARAHGVRFQEINPANTLVQAKLIGDGYRVEIEAEASLIN